MFASLCTEFKKNVCLDEMEQSFVRIRESCNECTHIVLFVLGVFGFSLVFVLMILQQNRRCHQTPSSANMFRGHGYGSPIESHQSIPVSLSQSMSQSMPVSRHVERPEDRENQGWSVVGKIADNTKRAFVLLSRKHPTRKHRYLYQARSIDLISQTLFVLCRDGRDISSEYNLGSDELFTSDIVHLPEISTDAAVFITNHICS